MGEAGRAGVAAGAGKVWETDGASIGGAGEVFPGIWSGDAAAGSGEDCPPQAASSRPTANTMLNGMPTPVKTLTDTLFTLGNGQLNALFHSYLHMVSR